MLASIPGMRTVPLRGKWRVVVISQAPLEYIDRAISRLCQACGFCCNGVLFSHVLLIDEDALLTTVEIRYYSLTCPQDSEFQASANAFGSPEDSEAARKLEHPCSFHKKNRCSVYNKRPARCHEYECRLVREVCSNNLSVESAEDILTEAVELYDQLKKKLRNVNRGRSFWVQARRLAGQPDFHEPGVYKTLGIDQDTMPLVKELATILDRHFHPTPGSL